MVVGVALKFSIVKRIPNGAATKSFQLYRIVKLYLKFLFSIHLQHGNFNCHPHNNGVALYPAREMSETTRKASILCDGIMNLSCVPNSFVD
jgi:hypothetical protein